PGKRTDLYLFNSLARFSLGGLGVLAFNSLRLLRRAVGRRLRRRGVEVDVNVGVHQRADGDDHAGPERDLQDADAVGDLLVAPIGEASVDLVELAVDARLDLVELLVDVGVGALLQAVGDAAEQAGLFDVLLDAGGFGRRGRRGGGGGRLPRGRGGSLGHELVITGGAVLADDLRNDPAK